MAKDDKKQVCDGCKKVDARISALFAYMKSTILRCPCGMLCVREIRLDHPVAGMTSFKLCDSCMPKDVYQDGLTKMEDLMLERGEEAFAINEALRG